MTARARAGGGRGTSAASDPFRRIVLRAAAALGLTAVVGGWAARGSAHATRSAPPPRKERNRGCEPKGKPVATTAEIPLGSGALYEFEELIITQPAEGSFRGFSPVCPHQGCLIDVFENDRMICTCHGGAYSIKDGRRISGPSKRGAKARDIVVLDGQIYHATCRRKAAS